MAAFGNRDNPRVVDDYVRALHEIMAENGIAPVRQPPGHIVSPNATFAQVVQYTDWYIADRGGRSYYQRPENPLYRYNRYMRMLRQIQLTEHRKAHIDIGCGAGLFSWAFLDWATSNGVDQDRIDIYGIDHSQSMIDLAREMRDRLTQYLPDFPQLHYFPEVGHLLQELNNNHRRDTTYTITLGHVLVQAHDPNSIRDFTRVIAHTVRLENPRNSCNLIAVDALNRVPQLAMGWQALLDSLRQAGILSRTVINGNHEKAAVLYLEP